MDIDSIERALAREMVVGWDLITTGTGLLIRTNWRLPSKEPIEIHVRLVGEREDLFLLTDGGETFSTLFLQGLNLHTDKEGADALENIASAYGVKLVDGRMVKGANENDLGQAVRLLLEAVKEASFVLWCRAPAGGKNIH